MTADRSHTFPALTNHEGLKQAFDEPAGQRRLMACWNAFDGTPTAFIEAWPPRELRLLRLHHWRAALAARQPTQSAFAQKLRAQEHDHHMKAVQALNCCFPIGDTAERDSFKQPHEI